MVPQRLVPSLFTDFTMLDKLQRRNLQLAQLNEASQQLTATLESGKVMTRMLQIATEIVGARDASVWTWEDAQRDVLTCRATSDEGLFAALRQLRMGSGEGIVGAVAKSGKSEIVPDVELDKRFFISADQQTGLKTKNLLSVPLIVRGEVLGVLQILNKPDPFVLEDVTLAETLAASAAIALDNARLIEALQMQKNELETRNAELDAFAHTVAHDLKTPLNWINGYMELLVKDWDRLPESERIDYARAGQHGAQMMSNIVDELLLLASLRESEIEIGRVNMQAVIANVRGRIKLLLDQYNATIVVAEDMPDVRGYSPWIEGVWVNYMTNALKYGGVPPHIQLGYEREGSEIKFWVQDNGEGLTVSQKAKLFVPFSRLGGERAHGHGLGLSIVQRIVHRLGGTVGVESLHEQGSRFYFTLPSF
jgi:signal transduction histidine kinase